MPCPYQRCIILKVKRYHYSLLITHYSLLITPYFLLQRHFSFDDSGICRAVDAKTEFLTHTLHTVIVC